MIECIAERIAGALTGICPAFHRNKSVGGAVWHGCLCYASGTKNAPCVCVWQEVSKCKTGKWPHLAFVDDYRAAERAEAAGELERAKKAIEKLKSNSPNS